MEALRNQIDDLDIEIIKLLDKRIEICKKVGEFKKQNNIPITHSKREDEIVNRLSTISELSKDEIASLYEIIFRISKSKQKI